MLENYTPYQQKIIKNYYANLDKVALQKLSELLTELYLAEGKKRKQLWKTAIAAMEKIGVPKSRIDHLVGKDDAAQLAILVKELHSAK
jgi:hypothetical protein